MIEPASSSLGAGVGAALAAFEDASERPRALVVASDGEDPDSGRDLGIAAANASRARVVTIALGSEAGGSVPDGARTLLDRDGAPWVVADVKVDYPLTAKRDLLSNMQQKLRRYLDLRWIEVAPFPLRPRLEGTRDAPLRVWKRNWLGVATSFPLDYARINPANAELDAFNHQVTAGWVAVTDGSRGLLVGQSSDVRSSYAFAPMRLREEGGRQELQLNPFGTYHGRQLDYSHMGGTGIGTEFTNLGSNALRPNGPSYNGESERFSLLLAPYAGDEPPAPIQVDAEAFYRPPAVLYTKTLAAGVRVPADVHAIVAAGRLENVRGR